LQTSSHGTKTAAKSPGNSDGSLFGEVIPAEVEQKVMVKPSWLPLSKQLAALQDATAVPLTRARSVPDDPLFVAAPACTEFALLRQMRLLLTDDQCRGQWDSQGVGKDSKDVSKDKHSYRLWREAVSPQEQRAKRAQVVKDRLAKVLALLAAGPDAWRAVRGEDPDLSSGLSQPICQAPLLLAGKLSPEQVDGVLLGQPLTLHVADMSPEDQALVRQSIAAVPDNTSSWSATSTITGEKRTIFDMRHLLATGDVVFKATPLVGDPGSLELALHVYTEPTHEFAMDSNGMLYFADSGFAEQEKQQIAGRHQQEAADALAAKTPGAKTVTIDRAAQPQPGKPPLAAYLRAFAEQTKLTVLAHWPPSSKALTDAKGLSKRLPASIINKPAGEALDILFKTYGGEWVQDEATVRLRVLPVPEPAVKRVPVVPAPPASPAASPVPGK